MALGLFTTLAQAITPVEEALNIYDPSGSLSGKTTATVAVWLIAWVVLHRCWKSKQVNFDRVFIATLLLIALGILGTFPLFFRALGS